MLFDNDDGTAKAIALQKAPNNSDCIGDFYSVMLPMVRWALETKFARCEDASTIDDLTQDITLKLIAKIKQYDVKKAKLFNWATMVLRNTAYDYFRKEKRNVPSELSKEIAADQKKSNWVDIDAEVLSDMRSFFPFHVSVKVFYELFGALERYRFTPDQNLMNAIGKIYRAADIDYQKFGRLEEHAQFLVGLYRAWMIDDTSYQYDKMVEAMESSEQVGMLRILRRYLPEKSILVLLHLSGGIKFKLPTPRALYAAKPKTR